MTNTADPYAMPQAPSFRCARTWPREARSTCAISNTIQPTKTRPCSWMTNGRAICPRSAGPKYVGQKPTSTIPHMNAAKPT